MKSEARKLPLSEGMMTFGRTITFELPPFGISTNTRMIFSHARFDAARQGLLETVVHGNGFGVVTGEVGTGKTTLLHQMIADLPGTFDVALVMNTCLKPDELLFAIGEDLGLGAFLDPSMTRRQILNAINRKLISNYESGRRTAIVIDEAQHLSEETLETVRMISNLQTETQRPVGIILFGQPPLREMLRRPELSPFVSRIGAHYHMDSLTLNETSEYIRHRIASSGPSRPVGFSIAAVRLLHRISDGYPRRINIVAGKALVDAITVGKLEVEVGDIKKAAKTVMMTVDPKRRERNLVTAASWVLVLVIAAFGWWNFGSEGDAGPEPSVRPVALESRPAEIVAPAAAVVAAPVEPAAMPVQPAAPTVQAAPSVVPAAPRAAVARFRRVLRLGARGEDVHLLQQRLQKMGLFDGVPTGLFNFETEIAVQKFQLMRSIKADGVVGYETIEALRANGSPHP